jgi:protein Tex
MPDNVSLVASELKISAEQVQRTADLFAEGATVPFISRYRKEVTGSLDEVTITSIRDRLAQLEELDKRRNAIVESLNERDLLTDELTASLAGSETLTELEDIYLPFRPKRRTRAIIAREKGLEPLALLLLAQTGEPIPVTPYITEEEGVANEEDALAGARDIIAELVSEDGDVRRELRGLFAKRARLTSTVIKKRRDDASKYQDYFDWSEPVERAPSHRILAALRGGNEGFLTVHALPEEAEALVRLERRYVRGRGFASEQVRLAAHDAYKRLLLPVLERETLKAAKSRADLDAIHIFVTNVRELLMAPPLGGKRVLAIDPGFRTGCKVVTLDATGTLKDNTTVFPTQGKGAREEATRTLRELVKRFSIEAIAVGNGTAGRETEAFVRDLNLDIPIIIVDESGASVYSASEVARTEFPDKDVTVRGAVSIGRRLQDPLAELVKVDPKAIGVGQYQHDVDQSALKLALDDTVLSCVNSVGVEVNSASAPLLTHVAGLGPQLAQNIVEWRDTNGPFSSRKDLMRVPRLGAKAFQQAAGFLRIGSGKNPLDKTAVHPERYDLVERMAADLNCKVDVLLADPNHRESIEVDRYVGGDVGRPTIEDILSELARPGRDPRPQFEIFAFADVHKVQDLEPGRILPGLVTNVTAFGAFVDVGVHRDGLVHVSELADRYVKDPNEVVKVRQQVRVKVMAVDVERGRISLSMRDVSPL